jgi:hypothetical protein
MKARNNRVRVLYREKCGQLHLNPNGINREDGLIFRGSWKPVEAPSVVMTSLRPFETPQSLPCSPKL